MGQPRALHPDFAELVRRAAAVTLRIDDGDLSVGDGMAAAGERARAGLAQCDFYYALFLFECCCSGRDEERRTRFWATGGDHQRRLGESERRVEGFAAEAAGRKRFCEPFNRLAVNGFGGVACNAPAGEVEPSAFVRRDFTRT